MTAPGHEHGDRLAGQSKDSLAERRGHGGVADHERPDQCLDRVLDCVSSADACVPDRVADLADASENRLLDVLGQFARLPDGVGQSVDLIEQGRHLVRLGKLMAGVNFLENSRDVPEVPQRPRIRQLLLDAAIEGGVRHVDRLAPFRDVVVAIFKVDHLAGAARFLQRPVQNSGDEGQPVLAVLDVIH